MRTNVTLDESLVNELLRLSGEKTKTAAVAAAVREQIRRAKREKLAGLLGKIEVDDEAVKTSKSADRKRDGKGVRHLDLQLYRRFLSRSKPSQIFDRLDWSTFPGVPDLSPGSPRLGSC